MADSFHVKKINLTDANTRPVAMCSLGPHVANAVLPHVDLSDTRTALTGAMYRFCRKIPNCNISRPHFRKFVQKWLRKNMKPLPLDADTSFENWIRKTPYTESRKAELTAKWNDMNVHTTVDDKIGFVKSFIKDETYPAFKHARAINSRSDEFKCLTGPIFQLISDELFKLPWFIKKIPVRDRPQYIIDRCLRTGETYLLSDYTSFEAHFDEQRMEDCELQLYRYMAYQIAPWFVQLVERFFVGQENEIFFKNFIIAIYAKRMSGEMCTSLGNGFSNLMFMLYLCKVNGNKHVTGVIEGDDGLFVMKGSPPAQVDFVNFGLNIKMGSVSELNHASFCGMVFDLDDRTNITNIIEELVSFGWTTRRYARSRRGVHMCLLRAKALSLAYQYPACPVLSVLAFKICKLTASYDVQSWLKKQRTYAFNQYELEMVDQAIAYFKKNQLAEEPGYKTRLLVQELYGLTIQDQFAIEKYIEGMTTLMSINCPTIDKYLKPDWVYFSHYFTLKVSLKLDFDKLQLAFPKVRPYAPVEKLTSNHR
jgi:hypothetical protein